MAYVCCLGLVPHLSKALKAATLKVLSWPSSATCGERQELFGLPFFLFILQADTEVECTKLFSRLQMEELRLLCLHSMVEDVSGLGNLGSRAAFHCFFVKDGRGLSQVREQHHSLLFLTQFLRFRQLSFCLLVLEEVPN